MTSERPLRADAARNRERLLEVAVRAFAHPADDATVGDGETSAGEKAFANGRGEPSLEALAKEAGVGIGTLYRHFPTREALVEAVYRNELGRLCAAAGELLGEAPADVAMRTWMDRFVDYMTTKRGMAEALRAVIASGGNPFEQSRARLLDAVETLLAAGRAQDLIRTDIEAQDITTSLSGISLAAGEPSQRAQASRLLDLLMDGLRFQTPPS